MREPFPAVKSAGWSNAAGLNHSDGPGFATCGLTPGTYVHIKRGKDVASIIEFRMGRQRRSIIPVGVAAQ